MSGPAENLKASDWVKRYAFESGFSIYSKQIRAVLAFLDAVGLRAPFPERSGKSS
jgi:hypothetical protein